MTQTKAELLQTRHQGDIRLSDADSTNYVGFKAPATVGSNLVWTLPATDGSADQFLQTNASGVLSWGTADTSASMSLTGGTFTGDVTFDGATAGRDIVFDRSDNALEFADNAKVVFGSSTDLSIYHDSSNSYIKEAGTGQLHIQADNLILENAAGANYLVGMSGGETIIYHNDSIKLTTASTGVAITGALTVSTNATISGNLTVSGTTTTINTATLDVEDKNVVLGKVSSPSDTTADGGGWTLKGATDKTFNWVDATDAWTSSEHIHLGDNKKLLLGTGSDLQLWHDGSNSYIKDGGTGDLIIRASDQLKIQETDNGETMAVFNKDGAVDLYHNDVKKFETTSGGINVTGAIQVNGAALATAPTITATANGSISANEAVIVESDGKVAGVTGFSSSTSSMQNGPQMDHSYGPRYIQTAWNEGNETIFAIWYEHTGNSGQSKIVCAAGTLSGASTTSVTWGSKVTVYTGTARWPQVASLGSNKFLLTWAQDSNAGKGQIATVSGTSVTLEGSPTDDNLSNRYNDSDLIALTSTKALLVYAHNSGDNNNIKVITISGNSISFGSPTQCASSNAEGGYNRLIKLSDTKALWTYFRQGFQTVYGRIVTVGSSDTTVTFGTNEAIFIDNKGFNHVALYDDVKGQGAFIWDYANRHKPAALRWNYSGTTLTVQTSTITNDLTDANMESYQIKGDISATGEMHIAFRDHYDSGLDYFRLTQDGDTFSVNDSVQDAVSGTDVMAYGEHSPEENASIDVQLVGANKFLISWGATSANDFKTFVRQYPATDATTENFIGFSSAGYTNGQTATINVVGNTTTQSSLTPGQKYYVQHDGSLSLTAADPSIIGGRALTSTSLLITHS